MYIYNVCVKIIPIAFLLIHHDQSEAVQVSTCEQPAQNQSKIHKKSYDDDLNHTLFSYM